MFFFQRGYFLTCGKSDTRHLTGLHRFGNENLLCGFSVCKSQYVYNNYGICNNAYPWLDSYLDNRRQTCSVNGSVCRSCLLRCGVHQGTILGPLLLLLCINDLPNCQSRMYADDTHLTFAGFSADNIQPCLNDDLVNVSNWLIANKLTLYVTKTEFMLIGSSRDCAL